ncbi:MAG: diguanylate cyclase [Pleurocapsa sp. MO_226.B13]|nr:diguanylate cyclase [Pleurocapsa sp. MO_226.B13]
MFTAERSPLPNAKILIVDDRQDNLELLSTILSSEGYQVQKCESGQLAIELAKTEPLDLIVLDISMPEMDGFEVCQILKNDSHTQDIPIIFISSLTDVNDKTKAFEYGGNDYITKPFQIEEVLARVRNQLKIRHLQMELQAKNARLEKENRDRQDAEAQLLRLTERLGKLAMLDGLTQIANRLYFDEFLTREWQRGQREQFPLSLIISDVDYFKLYNDCFGHQQGDLCLIKVAQVISKVAKRPADLVARYGGEEFVVVLPRTPAQSALKLADEIRLEVKGLCLEHPQSLVSNYVSLSLGVSSIVPNFKFTKKQLLVTADRALYQAKKQGRDRTILQLLD